MGSETGQICRDCGHRFRSMDGPGMLFAVLRCETCGAEVSVSMEEAGERFDYDGERDALFDRGYPGSMMDIATRKHSAECSGRCTFDAPVRCPACKSTRLEFDREADRIMYD